MLKNINKNLKKSLKKNKKKHNSKNYAHDNQKPLSEDNFVDGI